MDQQQPGTSLLVGRMPDPTVIKTMTRLFSPFNAGVWARDGELQSPGNPDLVEHGECCLIWEGLKTRQASMRSEVDVEEAG